jgi:autotransporter-associated beta strand protein
VLVLMDNTTNIPASLGVAGGNNFLVAGDPPARTNGMAPAFFLGARNGGSGQATFLTYDMDHGFKPVAYDVTNSTAGWDATKIVSIDNKTIAADTTAYALRVTNTLTLAAGVTVGIGDNGATPAGLIVQQNINGGTLDFGASEAIVFAAGNYAISSSIAGSGGLTKTQYAGTNGILTLAGTNTFSGTVTINTGVLGVGAGGTSGDLGASTAVVMAPGSTLAFNRSDAAAWAGAVSGAGTIQKAGPGDFALTLAGDHNLATVQSTNARRHPGTRHRRPRRNHQRAPARGPGRQPGPDLWDLEHAQPRDQLDRRPDARQPDARQRHPPGRQRPLHGRKLRAAGRRAHGNPRRPFQLRPQQRTNRNHPGPLADPRRRRHLRGAGDFLRLVARQFDRADRVHRPEWRQRALRGGRRQRWQPRPGDRRRQRRCQIRLRPRRRHPAGARHPARRCRRRRRRGEQFQLPRRRAGRRRDQHHPPRAFKRPRRPGGRLAGHRHPGQPWRHPRPRQPRHRRPHHHNRQLHG